jgi:hypothetical protein
MRLLASLLVLPLAACPSPDEPDAPCVDPPPLWEVSLSSRTIGFEPVAFAATPDGGAILAINDPELNSVELDGQWLDGPHVAAIDPDGVVTALVPAPSLRGAYVESVHAGPDGPIVVAGTSDELRLVALDPQLGHRWSRVDAEGSKYSAVDVAPSGEIALWRADSLFGTTGPGSSVHLLERDGAERWVVQVPDPVPAALRIADNGDVLVDGNTPARYAAADGALAAPRPGPSEHIARDGTSVQTGPRTVRLRDAVGNLHWAAAVEGEPWSPSILPDGNVIFTIDVQVGMDTPSEHWRYYAIELDGVSGSPVGEVEQCRYPYPMKSARDAYLTFSSNGIAMFPRPGDAP